MTTKPTKVPGRPRKNPNISMGELTRLLEKHGELFRGVKQYMAANPHVSLTAAIEAVRPENDDRDLGTIRRNLAPLFKFDAVLAEIAADGAYDLPEISLPTVKLPRP